MSIGGPGPLTPPWRRPCISNGVKPLVKLATCYAITAVSHCALKKNKHDILLHKFLKLNRLILRHYSSSSNFNTVFPRVRRWPDVPHSLSNRSHSLSRDLARSVASSTLNPIFFKLSSTCLFQVCFGRPRFRCPFT